ncbi:hypothetical protein D3C72_2342520 [compost metagenome]
MDIAGQPPKWQLRQPGPGSGGCDQQAAKDEKQALHDRMDLFGPAACGAPDPETLDRHFAAGLHRLGAPGAGTIGLGFRNVN